ncbi:hypothetical protein Ae717Ps2_6463c [Pseudonocardia sp. Ae717_Ps2]|uniref:hypothetical protein n=1 Tax=Pseudonocardia sp. Ae717_Ps2 TaxID=1885573 RepID=UPI000961D251|nr:hypothetical protein [Pseudonocardia sp. Ae717_Ps2]OLM28404.1 hypothetical protein Ae717Ps2_6463c [Pseudonocardia sp. Ae717_Ps2]
MSASSSSSAGREPNRRRGYVIAAGVGALAVLLAAGLVYTIAGWLGGRDDEPAPVPAPPPVAAGVETREWASEQELADAPMLALPDAAGQPHTLTTETAGPPITLPAPGRVVGVPFPDSFPATPEGAIAQLVAMSAAGMLGGDPADYARAHDSITEAADAPRGNRALFSVVLTNFRKNAGLPAHGPKPGLSVSWVPRAAQIKGTVGDRFVVACVLGEFVADYYGRVASAGMGDCQSMRRVQVADGSEQWRIARAMRPEQAPSPWPGTAEAVAAGYRDLAR